MSSITKHFIAAEVVSEYLRYEEGKLFWRKSPKYTNRVGREAGTLMSHGRTAIRLFGVSFLRNRLIYSMFYGDIPKDLVIDHINGDRSDDRIENLRAITQHQNSQHSRKRPGNNKYKGVYKKSDTQWHAHIKINYQRLHIGVFKTEREAAEAYNTKAIELMGIFAKLNEMEGYNE